MYIMHGWLGLFCTLACVLPGVDSHGMLLQPPQRSSLWRFPDRFPHAPHNYNDNELFCGGLAVMHQQNHHLCGVCGDASHLPQPRPNEAGVEFGRGIIVASYRQGQVIDVTVRLIFNHLGYFVFKICPNNDVTRVVTQECLDRIVLQAVDGSGQLMGDRWPVPEYLNTDYRLRLQLPADLTCTQCVLQWTYTAGNTWGCDSSGHCALGMGDQETVVNCADVTILPTGGSASRSSSNSGQGHDTPLSATATNTPPPPVTTPPQPETTTTVTHRATTLTHAPPSSSNCRDVTGHVSDDWCIVNCAQGYCPATFCRCD